MGSDDVEYPPGWYPDPEGGSGQRWWDGERWGPPLAARHAETSAWTEDMAAPGAPAPGAPVPGHELDP
jgi:hypothetical protein